MANKKETKTVCPDGAIGRKEPTMITAEIVEQYRKEHEEEVARVKRRLNSQDSVQRAYARSVVYGIHDPLLYAIKDREIFGCDYEGIEYVKAVFAKYGYQTKEYYEDDGIGGKIRRIDVLKDDQVRAKLTFCDLYNRVSMFSVK